MDADRVALTVETSAFSEMDEGVSTNVTVGASSSSVIVRVTADDSDAPLPPATVAATVTRLSGASVVLFTDVIVTVPVLVVTLAATVSVFVLDSVKSPATAGDTAIAETVIVVAVVTGRFSVAVTVETAPASEIDAGDKTNVTCATSSSIIVSVASVTDPVPMLLPTVLADTVTVLFPEDMLLSTVVIVTVPVLVVAPAATVSVFAPDSVKSPATAGDTADAETVIVVAALDGCERVAVTVETAPASEINAGATIIVTSGAASSSVIVKAAPVTLPAPWSLFATLDTVTLRLGASWVLSTAVISTVSAAFVVSPAAMVIVESDPTV